MGMYQDVMDDPQLKYKCNLCLIILYPVISLIELQLYSNLFCVIITNFSVLSSFITVVIRHLGGGASQ